MRHLFLLLVLSLVPLLCFSSFGFYETDGPAVVTGRKDTVDIQILYNGRAWRNLYYKIKGDQFLFSPAFLPGTVTIDGEVLSNLNLSYDIFNDELILNTSVGFLIQLNKEMIDCFTIEYNSRDYRFKRLDSDSVNSVSGYVNVLYEGDVSLFIKYRKEILILAVDNRYDLFNESSKIYLKKEGVLYRVNSRSDFLNLLKDRKAQLHSYIKTNKIHLSKSNPESMAQVLEFYDKIHH